MVQKPRPTQPGHGIEIRDLPVGAFVVDETMRVAEWNSAAEHVLGYSADHAVGRLCGEVFCPESPRLKELCRSHCNLARHTASAHTPSVDIVVRRGDGSTKRVLLRTAVTHAPDGQPRILHLVDDLDEHIAPLGVARRDNRPASQPDERDNRAGIANPLLSTRESEVLRMLAHGQSVTEIAGELGISQITVRNHVTHAMDKLGVNSRLRAVIAAAQRGLI
jgi:PAS domain S-box-containing protein